MTDNRKQFPSEPPRQTSARKIYGLSRNMLEKKKERERDKPYVGKKRQYHQTIHLSGWCIWQKNFMDLVETMNLMFTFLRLAKHVFKNITSVFSHDFECEVWKKQGKSSYRQWWHCSRSPLQTDKECRFTWDKLLCWNSKHLVYAPLNHHDHWLIH